MDAMNEKRMPLLGDDFPAMRVVTTYGEIDLPTHYAGKWFVHRQAPFGKVHLEDEDYQIDLSEKKDPSQKGCIIATKRLTDERWENFIPGELIVFRNGEIIYTSSEKKITHVLTACV